MLVRKMPDLWKKTHATSAQTQYTFEVSKTEEIFYFLVKEKFITFPENYKAPTKEELKAESTVSTMISIIIQLIIVGLLEMWCRTGLTKEF